MLDPHIQLHEALVRIRRATVDALATAPTIAKLAAGILKDVDEVERAYRAVAERLTLDNPRVGRPRKAAVVSHYAVEAMPSHGGDGLTEHRTTGAQPFRCPKDVYDAAATVLSGSARPVKFDEVQKGVQVRLRRKVPSYQVRLVMRFWSVKGLLQHRRARFVSSDPSRLEAEASRLFAAMGKRPEMVQRDMSEPFSRASTARKAK